MRIFYYIMLIFFKSEPKYAYKRYAYKEKSVYALICFVNSLPNQLK